MKLLKDLLYDRGNQALDISRMSSLMAVLTYCGTAVYMVARKGEIDLLALGTGWATLAGGCAAWIFARQKMEAGKLE